MKDKLTTTFGNIAISDKGYYRFSGGENVHKYFHRVIWENFYGCEVPKGYHIHHKNGNKLDNCILNLQLVSKSQHHKHHQQGENNSMYGKQFTKDHASKLSQNGECNFFRVSVEHNPSFKKGIRYKYCYYDEDHNHKSISRVDIKELEAEVKKRNLEWFELTEDN